MFALSRRNPYLVNSMHDDEDQYSDEESDAEFDYEADKATVTDLVTPPPPPKTMYVIMDPKHDMRTSMIDPTSANNDLPSKNMIWMRVIVENSVNEMRRRWLADNYLLWTKQAWIDIFGPPGTTQRRGYIDRPTSTEQVEEIIANDSKFEKFCYQFLTEDDSGGPVPPVLESSLQRCLDKKTIWVDFHGDLDTRWTWAKQTMHKLLQLLCTLRLEHGSPVIGGKETLWAHSQIILLGENEWAHFDERGLEKDFNRDLHKKEKQMYKINAKRNKWLKEIFSKHGWKHAGTWHTDEGGWGDYSDTPYYYFRT